jgi:hypothetical protein
VDGRRIAGGLGLGIGKVGGIIRGGLLVARGGISV